MSAAGAVRLYLVTNTALCGGFEGVIATGVAAARGGADMIQVRDHDASTRELASLASALIDALDDEELATPVVVDDRLDVALAVGAAGAHLGQSDLDPVAARRIADAVHGPGFHIGWSVSTTAQAQEAARLPRGTVDLLGIGPFRATPTKPDAAAPLGLDGVAAVTGEAWNAGLANVVIGGVKLDDVRPLVAAGAQGVAVVSAICGQPDPFAATQALRAELDAAFAEAADDAIDEAMDDAGEPGSAGEPGAQLRGCGDATRGDLAHELGADA